jgi:hypothetical protein
MTLVVAPELDGVRLAARRKEVALQAVVVDPDRLVLESDRGVEHGKVGVFALGQGVLRAVEKADDGSGDAGGAAEAHEGLPPRQRQRPVRGQ